MNQEEIINYFLSYMIKHSKYYNEWYVGITSSPSERLFKEHKVDEDNSMWIYTEADTEEIARSTEKYFLDKGAAGGDGGGTYPRYVYAYKK